MSDKRNARRLAPFGLVLAAIATIAIAAGAQSTPRTDPQRSTADHDALEARVSALEERVTALESSAAAPAPTTSPTGSGLTPIGQPRVSGWTFSRCPLVESRRDIFVTYGWTRPRESRTAYSSDWNVAPASTSARTRVVFPLRERPGMTIARPRHPTTPACTNTRRRANSAT